MNSNNKNISQNKLIFFLSHLTRFIVVMLLVILCFIVPNIQAQESNTLYDPASAACKTQFNAMVASPIPNFLEVVNPQSLFPIIPAVCTTRSDGSANSLSLGFLTYSIIKLYKIIIAFGFYLFTIYIMANGVMYQVWSMQGDSTAQGKVIKNIKNGVMGILYILLAFFVIQIILWLFNITNILDVKILDQKPI
jgi:hypothetical protein